MIEVSDEVERWSVIVENDWIEKMKVVKKGLKSVFFELYHFRERKEMKHIQAVQGNKNNDIV